MTNIVNIRALKIIIVFIFFLPLMRCARQNNKIIEIKKDSKFKSIKIDFSENTINPSELIDSIWYLKLETPKNILVGSVNKLICCQNNLYILDKKTNSIFIFDLKGKFIANFSKSGRGPGEFSRISDFYIDTINKNIIISDINMKMRFYDMNFNFIKEYKTKFSFISFSKTKERFLFATNIPNLKPYDYNLLICDLKMNVIDNYFPNEDIIDGHANNLYPYEFGINYVYSINQSIFSIASDSIFERYKIDFGTANMPVNLFNGKKMNAIDAIRKSEYPIFLDNIIETDNLVYFRFLYHHFVYSCYYSKITSKIKYGYKYSKELPIIGSFFQQSIYGNIWVGSLDAANFLKIFISLKKDIANENYQNYLNQLSTFSKIISEYDNPILIFTKIKSF